MSYTFSNCFKTIYGLANIWFITVKLYLFVTVGNIGRLPRVSQDSGVTANCELSSVAESAQRPPHPNGSVHLVPHADGGGLHGNTQNKVNN